MGFISKFLNKFYKRLHAELPIRNVRAPLIARVQNSSNRTITQALKVRGFTYGDHIAFLTLKDFQEITFQAKMSKSFLWQMSQNLTIIQNATYSYTFTTFLPNTTFHLRPSEIVIILVASDLQQMLHKIERNRIKSNVYFLTALAGNKI